MKVNTDKFMNKRKHTLCQIRLVPFSRGLQTCLEFLTLQYTDGPSIHHHLLICQAHCSRRSKHAIIGWNTKGGAVANTSKVPSNPVPFMDATTGGGNAGIGSLMHPLGATCAFGNPAAEQYVVRI